MDWARGERGHLASPGADVRPIHVAQRVRGLVLRGGSWNHNARNLRVSNRNNHQPDEQNSNIGFRCVREEERGRSMVPEATEFRRAKPGAGGSHRTEQRPPAR